MIGLKFLLIIVSQMKNIRLVMRNFTQVYLGIFLIGLLLAIRYNSIRLLNGDQLQTLYRGYLVMHQSKWLNYGNAASAVGNVLDPCLR